MKKRQAFLLSLTTTMILAAGCSPQTEPTPTQQTNHQTEERAEKLESFQQEFVFPDRYSSTFFGFQTHYLTEHPESETYFHPAKALWEDFSSSALLSGEGEPVFLTEAEFMNHYDTEAGGPPEGDRFFVFFHYNEPQSFAIHHEQPHSIELTSIGLYSDQSKKESVFAYFESSKERWVVHAIEQEKVSIFKEGANLMLQAYQKGIEEEQNSTGEYKE